MINKVRSEKSEVRSKKESGQTLIETLAALAIIAIVISAIATSVTS